MNHFHGDYQQHPELSPRNRTTDAPISMDVDMSQQSVPPMAMSTGMPGAPVNNGLPPFVNELLARMPRSWVGMSGYLVAGIFLGLVLIAALSIGRPSDANAALPPPSPNAIMDNVVRLHARDIGNTCWAGLENKQGPARLTVALEVGIDGKIRYAAASGETPSMRECVETHVKQWEFLPQAQAQTMALPFEVDRR